MPDFTRSGYGVRGRQFGSMSGVVPSQPLPVQCVVIEQSEIPPLTPEDMKVYLGNMAPTKFDKLVGDLVKSVTAQIERISRYDLSRKTRRAYWERPGYLLRLPYGPHYQIIEVVGIDMDGVETVFVEDTDYRVEGMDQKSIRILDPHSAVSIEVEFESGYAECPPELASAVQAQVSMLFKNRQDPTVPLRMMENGLCPEAYSLVRSVQKLGY